MACQQAERMLFPCRRFKVVEEDNSGLAYIASIRSKEPKKQSKGFCPLRPKKREQKKNWTGTTKKAKQILLFIGKTKLTVKNGGGNKL